MGGFDSVDDESLVDTPLRETNPKEWTEEINPHYAYQLYYISTNIHVLNQLRKSMGLNVFSFRPHAGESGDEFHLAASYLVANNINHGIRLRKLQVLQYLYYLDQIGCAITPVSNAFLFKVSLVSLVNY